MTVSIHLPALLQSYCNNAPAELSVAAPTVRAALEQLARGHPELYQAVCDETGAVRTHINLFVNDAVVSGADGMDSVLSPGDVLTIMPAVSGG